MKRTTLTLAIVLLGLTLGGFSVTDASAQTGLNIGVVDMQECLNKYHKTKQEVDGVNKIAKEKQAEIDSKRVDYETLTKKAAGLDEKARDTSLSAEQRQAAFTELQGIMQERMAKGREISEAERRAQQEIIQARQRMEQVLVADIRVVVDAHAAAKGLDLVFDRSFLPKANKVVLHVSDKVPDLTAEIIAELNKDAPAGAAAPATATPTTPATPSKEGN